MRLNQFFKQKQKQTQSMIIHKKRQFQKHFETKIAFSKGPLKYSYSVFS